MLSENEIKTWIEKLKSDKEVQDLIKELGITPQNESQLWANLLSVLSREETPMEEIGPKGLFYFIQTHCDLENGEEVSELYKKIKEDKNFWNESLQDLSNFFQEKMSLTDDQVILETTKEEISDNKAITIATLKDSDAAYSFKNQWVNPWRNIDGDSYDEVRKKDEVLDILKNANKLQYTREKKKEVEEKIAKWLRLIMPQYGRRVEIEDLDRNFWTIGQVVAAISNYLFGKDAPLPKVLQGALREVTELWENALYLWLTTAMISQKGSGKVKVIVLPLPSRSNENGRHYDNIDSDDNICSYEYKGEYVTIKNHDGFNDMIKERIKYLRDQYFNESLCVVPYIRLHNYKHNYYSMEYYPVVCTSVAGSEDWTIQSITEAFNEKDYPLVISPEVELQQRYTPYLYSTKQDYFGSVAWQYPFSTVNVTPAPSRFMMYAALRTIPDIECVEKNGEIKINKFTLSVYDASAELVTNNKRLMGTYSMGKDNSLKLSYKDAEKDEVDKKNLITPLDYTQIQKGYYLGEVASWRDKTASISTDDNIFTNQAYVIKIGSFMPKNAKSFEMAQVSGYFTSMRGNVTTTKRDTNEIRYYKYQWDTYRESINGVLVDGDSIQKVSTTTNNYCYSKPPEEKGSEYFTEQNMREDGYVAVENFLAKQDEDTKNHAERYKSPCYILTSVGLTPWDNGERIYWDVGGICHIYLYIPHPQVLCPEHYDNTLSQDVRDRYVVKAYEETYKTYNKSTDSNVREVYRNINGKNTEIGKIISCQTVGQYETFCYMMDNYCKKKDGTVIEPKNYGAQDIYVSPMWRQFFVKNTSENNICKKVTYNEGPTKEDGKVVYSAVFDPTFNGEVSYYDARWNISRTTPLPNNAALISTGEIEINSIEGLIQKSEGYIHPRGETNSTKTSRAINSKSTNFPRPQNTKGEPTEKREIPPEKKGDKSTYDNAYIFSRMPKEKSTTPIPNYGTVLGLFHGRTPLNKNSSNNVYYI